MSEDMNIVDDTLDRNSRIFYVYYDDNDRIMGVSGKKNEGMDKYKYKKFDYLTVKDFLTGDKNPYQYFVEADKDNPLKFNIVKRSLEVNNIRTLDRFLAEIHVNVTDSFHIKIVNDIPNRKIHVSIDDELRKEIMEDKHYDEGDIFINGLKNLCFYACSKNDPSILLETFAVPTQRLLSFQEVSFDVSHNLTNASLFTKKIFENYYYEVKR